MKQILPLLFIGLLFITGCENFFGAGNGSGDPYAYDMLINDLDQDLGFSARQMSDSKDYLRSGGDYYPDNASLWRLALYLQENLTEEQKERLLSPPDNLDPQAFSEEMIIITNDFATISAWMNISAPFLPLTKNQNTMN